MVAILYSGSLLAVTLYKWIDADGKVSYQDHPPPIGQKYEEKSFSAEGARTGDANTEVARSRAIRENPIILYVAQNCESCDQLSSILDSNDVPYEEIEVDTDRDAQNELIELVGSVRVPTLSIGEQIIENFDRTTIEDALRENGYPATRTGVQ